MNTQNMSKNIALLRNLCEITGTKSNAESFVKSKLSALLVAFPR